MKSMEDLSLHILDIAENAINAGAKNVTIFIRRKTETDLLTIEIADDGEGMSAEAAEKVSDPFYTTRTTRRVGLGLPLLKAATEATGGHLEIRSAPGIGTRVIATFAMSHIDRKPLGDLAATIVMLVAGNPDVHFSYHWEHDGGKFSFSTRELREKYPALDLNAPEALSFIRAYLTDHSPSVS